MALLIGHRGQHSNFDESLLEHSLRINVILPLPDLGPPQAAVLMAPLGSEIPYSTLIWSRTTSLHHFARALCSTLLPYGVKVFCTPEVLYPCSYSVPMYAMG